MREAVGAVLDLRAPGPSGLSRAIKWSFGVHLAVAVGVLAWQVFMARAADRATEMTISLAGPAGPPTGGLNALGGRQVDVATPPPKKPDPIPPVAIKPDDVTVPVKSVTKPPPATRPAPVPQSSVVVPLAAGRQVTTGSSVVETGSRGESTGLAQGGGAGPQVDPKFKFCCMDYLALMTAELNRNVNWAQQTHGTVIVKFEIRSDGSIDLNSVTVGCPRECRSSGNPVLDFDAQRAVRSARLPALPKAYTETSLIVYLTVPY